MIIRAEDGTRTSEDVVLVVLVGLGAHLDEALESVVVDELVHQVLVILKRDDTRSTDISFTAKLFLKQINIFSSYLR